MENSSSKIMSSSSQRESEEDRTQLKLHSYEAKNSLQMSNKPNKIIV